MTAQPSPLACATTAGGNLTPTILLAYERLHGDRDDCIQPKTRLQTVPGGVSKSLRASKHSIGAVYAREITDETIHGDRLDADRDRRRVFQEGNIGGG